MGYNNCKQESPITYSQKEKEVAQLIYDAITMPEIPRELSEDLSAAQDADFKKLIQLIIALRKLSLALAKGDLRTEISEAGFVLSNLKTLQTNLRHFTNQAKMIAEGNFSEIADYAGEFSESFNGMVAKLKESNTKLINMATIDILTKVPNRLALTNFLEESFKSSIENSNEYSIIIFDIDLFKAVNDNYGHSAGDIVLQKISNILNNEFRSNDIFSRYGGEEFMAVLPKTSEENAIKIAERAIKKVENTDIDIKEKIIYMTVSAGVSSRHDNDQTYEQVIARADVALYNSKRNGRNRVSFS